MARKGRLRAPQLPTNIEYVNEAVQHLLDRRFAPRSDRSMDENGRRDFLVNVRGNYGVGIDQHITVPDITGELWRHAINTYELPTDWMEALKASSSAILFVRAHSKFNLQPMDWVTARDHLMGHCDQDDDEDDDDDYGHDEDEDGDPIAPFAAPTNARGAVGPATARLIGHQVDVSDGDTEGGLELHAPSGDRPTDELVSKKDELPAQVGFCELLRYLSLTLADRPSGEKPRLAVVVTAWDMLDAAAKAAGPMSYLEDQFPMFAGRLKTPGRLEIEVFGMSIVGGNLRGPANKAFRDSLKKRDLWDVGYTAVTRDGKTVEDSDVTLPLAWALGD